RGGTVRLAERPIRPILANIARHPRRNDARPEPGKSSPGNPGLYGNEKIRYRKTKGGLQRVGPALLPLPEKRWLDAQRPEKYVALPPVMDFVIDKIQDVIDNWKVELTEKIESFVEIRLGDLI